MTKNCVYSIPCCYGNVYKGETCPPLKVRQQKDQKAVVREEIEKSGIADHIWKEKGNHQPLRDKVKIIFREGHWKRRCFKKRYIFFHHTMCESTCDTMSSSATNQGWWHSFSSSRRYCHPWRYQAAFATGQGIKRMIYIYIYIYIRQIN